MVRSRQRSVFFAFGCFCALAQLVSAELPGFNIFLDRKPTLSEVKRTYTGAKYEPPYGCFLGAYIDLDSSLKQTYADSIGRNRRLPEEFEQVVGNQHATYFFYLGYGRPLPKDWVNYLAMQDKIVHIALEPTRGIQYVFDDEYLTTLAQDMADTKAKIFLRFGSEMNGAWVEYGKDPSVFKDKFRLVAKKMREIAPNVAMVWCPYTTPVAPIPSYYPGDQYVDWVGVNMYSVTFFDQDPKKPARSVHPTDMLDYVYRKYSAIKPIMVGEYGTTHFSALENRTDVGFARRNLYALYAGLPRLYPRVKCISYFNGNNLELEHRMNNNYAVTQNVEVLEAYRRLTFSEYFLKSATMAPPNSLRDRLDRTPVDARLDPLQNLPLAPMPIKEGQSVYGRLDLSAWCKTTDTQVKMRFKVDGKVLYDGVGKDKWFVTIGASRLSEGPHKISVEAWFKNRLLATKSVSVNVVH